MNRTLTSRMLLSVFAVGSLAAVAAAGPPYTSGPPYRAGPSRSMEDLARVPQGGEKVNLNLASADELAKVPGISAGMARAIVEYRDDNGPLHGVDELLNVKGIGKVELDRLRDRVSVR